MPSHTHTHAHMHTHNLHIHSEVQQLSSRNNILPTSLYYGNVVLAVPLTIEPEEDMHRGLGEWNYATHQPCKCTQPALLT